MDGWLTWAQGTILLDGDQGRTNPFTAARGDKMAMLHFANILWPLVIVGVVATHKAGSWQTVIAKRQSFWRTHINFTYQMWRRMMHTRSLEGITEEYDSAFYSLNSSLKKNDNSVSKFACLVQASISDEFCKTHACWWSSKLHNVGGCIRPARKFILSTFFTRAHLLGSWRRRTSSDHETAVRSQSTNETEFLCCLEATS